MSRKSRKRAARYAELSRARQRKRKQPPASAPEQTVSPAKETSAVAATREVTPAKAAVPSPAKTPAPKAPTARPQTIGKQALPDYRYVREDLKRIGILTGIIIVILIVLAFVLG